MAIDEKICVIREKSKHFPPYVMISKKIIFDDNLTLEEVGFLVYIITIGQLPVSVEIRKDVDTKSILKSLISKGYIVKTRAEKGFDYTVLESSQLKKEAK